MHVANKSQTMLTDNGKGLMAEASCLGLAPGEWPDMISVVDDSNEGFLFMKGRRIVDSGMFIGYTYVSRQGFILEVFND